VLVVSIAVQATGATPELRMFDAPVSAVRVHPQRWEAVAGIDLDRAPGEYAVTVHAGGESVTKTFRVTSRRFPTRTLKVNPDFVNPPKSVAARIESESRLVANAYQSSAPERLWSEPFVRPVPQPANSSFGTRSVFNGEPRASHGGTDFLSPSGTPIRAPNDGHVLVARPLYFAGGSVLIDHGAGLFSQMAHLSRIDVKEGQAVHRGEVVGLVGATGRVTGAHLHWAVRAAGARVDALSLLAVLGKE
jgi:murein DD-endopeptidase MepM/ murein hydrolase activator NlpD